MKAVILCAGYAKRLYPLTIDKAKPLLPISGKPILNYVVRNIENCDQVNEVIIVSNDKFYKDFVEWRSMNEFSKPVKILNDGTNTEETKLGGVGDLIFALDTEKIDDDILIILGDNLFDFNLKKFVDYFYSKDGNLIGVYDVRSLEDAKRLGVPEIKDGKVIGFEEKPNNPTSTLVSIGIYAYSKNTLGFIKDYLNTDLSRDGPGNLIPYIIRKEDIYSLNLDGSWFDIGDKEVYNNVNENWLK